MLKVRYTKKFKNDFKQAQKRGLPMKKLKAVITCLAMEKELPAQYHDHALLGKYTSFHECHIQPDWLLIYRIDHGTLEFIAQRTGTHSDLF
jgi:mRNA interferase YafQ